MIALRSFGELVMRHKGARICVMGGGPTLADEIAGVEADIWISANQHGARLRSVDYVVAMDNLHTVHKDPMQGIIREFTDAPIIGPWHWCDYGITNHPLAPRLMFTGVVASWVASLLGAHPVIMAGFGCYGGTHRTRDQHREYMPFLKCEVRVAAGPLCEFWPTYDPDEQFAPYVVPQVFDFTEVEHGITIKVIKPVEIRGVEYPVGTMLRVPKADVWRQLKHRSLVEVTA
jgi:hypothetical protein